MVTMLVRGDGLEKSMSKYLIDQIAGTSNINGGDAEPRSWKRWATAIWSS